MIDFVLDEPLVERQLAALRNEFARARTVVASRAVHTNEDCPPNTCRYCGKEWLRWEGALLDGHVRCSTTIEFCELLVAIIAQHRGISYQRIGDAIGVTISSVRVFVNMAQQARGLSVGRDR